MANANVQTITLAELELLASDVDDVCSGIVHAILFQRVIGLYRPLEGHMQSLDISFPQLDDDSIRVAVAEQVARFAARLNSFGRDVLCVKFFETRVIKRLLYETEEKLCWEQWYIPVRLLPATTTTSAGGIAAAAERQRCARNVSQRLQQIVDVVNNPKHYIPLLTSNLKVPFPYEIAPLKSELVAPPVATGAATGGGGIGDLWNLVSGATMK